LKQQRYFSENIVDLTKIQKNNYLSHEFVLLGNYIGANGNGGNWKRPRAVIESRHMYFMKKNNCRGNIWY
jgi:hypothetical protein